MPRNSQGIYSLPPGYLATTGQAILASQHNPPLEDLASSMTNSLPRTGAAPMLANLPMGGFKLTDMADGVADTDAATVGQIANITPVGSILDFAGAVSPIGWLLCNGQAVSRSAYPALFAVIGTTYGAGDGSTTFNLPDCRGRVRVGKDKASGVLSTFFGALATTIGGVLGAATHVLTAAQIAAHTHPVTGTAASAGSHTHNLMTQPQGDGGQTNFVSRSTNSSSATGNNAVQSGGEHTHPVTGTASANTGGEAHPNAQPTIVFNTIIKAI